ncbi:MAG TPA: ferritin-like domain-containing protein [Burkholderiaceae bacterium]|nr:ferritin-like domain-containing protein [Burkholderiaceae bacterium]
MSPIDAARQIDAAEDMPITLNGHEDDAVTLRGERIAEAEAVGSIPIPTTITGATTTTMAKLTGQRPEVLIDKLGERLAFERSGTRLYDALLVKCETMQGTSPAIPLDELRRFRDEEAEHFKLVVQALESLGADSTAQTPSADVIGVTSLGVLQTISDPRTTVTQSLNALLTIELTDNAGWELLIDLAEQTGHLELIPDFQNALQNERTHLVTIRGLVRQATLTEAK